MLTSESAIRVNLNKIKLKGFYFPNFGAKRSIEIVTVG